MATTEVCTIPECTEHYACRLRNKGMQVSPRALATRTHNWRPTPSIPPARNRELMYDHRPDGSMMPILKPDGTHIRRKEYEEKRHQIEANRRRIQSGAASP